MNAQCSYAAVCNIVECALACQLQFLRLCENEWRGSVDDVAAGGRGRRRASQRDSTPNRLSNAADNRASSTIARARTQARPTASSSHFMASASKSGKMDEARQRFGEFIARSEANATSRSTRPSAARFCCSWCARTTFSHAMKLLRFMIDRQRFAHMALLRRAAQAHARHCQICSARRPDCRGAALGAERVRLRASACTDTHQMSGIIGLAHFGARGPLRRRHAPLRPAARHRAPHAPPRRRVEDFGIRYELRAIPKSWGVVHERRHAAQRARAVRSRSGARFRRYSTTSPSHLDDNGRAPSATRSRAAEVRAIGWAADEPLRDAPPAAWFEYAVDVCLHLSQWHVVCCASQTLVGLFLTTAVQHQWQAKALPVLQLPRSTTATRSRTTCAHMAP
jgi:hypothetical protein